jgi:hypothetical protein
LKRSTVPAALRFFSSERVAHAKAEDGGAGVEPTPMMANAERQAAEAAVRFMSQISWFLSLSLRTPQAVFAARSAKLSVRQH